MFELGTHKHKLWRSSKHEFPGGTEGFYWGCNNAKDLEVRKETAPSLAGKPANVIFRPYERDVVWQKLFAADRGKIDASFGFKAFTTPPLAAFPSCDAKFTTTALAKELKSWALFGPPLGRTWDATPEQSRRLSELKSLVPQRLDPAARRCASQAAKRPWPKRSTWPRFPRATRRQGRGPRSTRPGDTCWPRPGMARCCPRATAISGWPRHLPTMRRSSRWRSRCRKKPRASRSTRTPRRELALALFAPQIALAGRRAAPWRRFAPVGNPFSLGHQPLVSDRRRQGRDAAGRAAGASRRRGVR